MASSTASNSKQPTPTTDITKDGKPAMTVGSRVISPYTLMKGFVTIQEEKELRKKAHKQSKDTKVS